MPYIPHTDEDRRQMLDVIGAKSIDDLFADVPDALKLKKRLDIPPALDEHKLLKQMASLANSNACSLSVPCFLGAGIYDRYIPATVGAVISRGEFLTAYTPYQPELSQGYLQAIYEFQSMTAALYGMDVANASMYDGSTAMAEAAIMAHGVEGRNKIVVSHAVHPHYRRILHTYCWALGLTVEEVKPIDGATTRYDQVDRDAACVIVQYPNFFGVIEDLDKARAAAREAGALFIVVADPTACALLKPPGEYDADIVVGEGQPLGIAMGLGGPLLGLFCCKDAFKRRMPGRVVGRTTDHDGRAGYVMTMRVREQDIRREKATSNICTNEALMGLAATVYMSAMGKNGLRQVAEASVRNAQYTIKALTDVGGRLKFPGKVFDEFVMEFPVDATVVQLKLLQRGILAGLPLGPYHPSLQNCLLIAVTETRTKAEIDDYAAKLTEVLA